MNAVVQHESQPTETQALILAIERAASNPRINLDKMERLLALQERILGQHKEQQFNEAMTAAQTEIGRVATDAENSQTRSRYATYAQLDRHLRPIYTKHGFALSFDEADSPKSEHVRVLAYVSHSAGHCRTYHTDMPADGKGAKGGDVMTKTHAVGSAKQYGMRYLLKGIFNVAIGEDPDDDDGNGAGRAVAYLSTDQATHIKDLIREFVETRREAVQLGLLEWLKCASVEQIPAAAYRNAVKALEEKLAAR